jgi:hypothetical protein
MRWLTRGCAHRAQQLGGDVAFQQPIAVLEKRRVIPGSIVNVHADEPAKQEIELQPLHQLTLRPDRVEHLQQHRPQQLLGRNRGATHPGIERQELARQPRQSRVHDHADRPQRILANPLFEIDVTEQRPCHGAPSRILRGRHLDLASPAPGGALWRHPCDRRRNGDSDPSRKTVYPQLGQNIGSNFILPERLLIALQVQLSQPRQNIHGVPSQAIKSAALKLSERRSACHQAGGGQVPQRPPRVETDFALARE